MAPSLPPRLLPVGEEAEQVLKRRTLTNLYNEGPTWLANLHADLDAVVFAAYGWPESGRIGHWRSTLRRDGSRCSGRRVSESSASRC